MGLIEGMYLRRPAPSAATVHRAAAIAAAAHGWDAPSYNTVRNIVGARDPALVTLAQQRVTAYQLRGK